MNERRTVTAKMIPTSSSAIFLQVVAQRVPRDRHLLLELAHAPRRLDQHGQHRPAHRISHGLQHGHRS
jgi:hypothetical protein